MRATGARGMIVLECLLSNVVYVGLGGLSSDADKHQSSGKWAQRRSEMLTSKAVSWATSPSTLLFSGKARAKLCSHRLRLGRGPNSANLGRLRPTSGRFGQIWPSFWANSTDSGLGPNSTKFRRHRNTVVRVRATPSLHRSNSAWSRPDLSGFGSNFTEVGQVPKRKSYSTRIPRGSTCQHTMY